MDSRLCCLSWKLLSFLLLCRHTPAQATTSTRPSISCRPHQTVTQISKTNYTLSVTPIFINNTTLRLTCRLSSNAAVLLNYQYLKWSEKGTELPAESYSSPSFSGETVVTINNASYFDAGVYTCQCYNNFTVCEIEEIYYNSGHQEYHHYCSEPFTVTALLTKDQRVSISDHIVNTINTIVEISCNDTTDLLYDANNSSESIDYPLSVIVDSPSKQGKYVCVDQSNNLTTIHYILIEDYEAPVFLFPSSESSVIYASHGTVPTCAVYSSIPMKSLKFYLISGDAVIPIGEDSSLNTGLYLVTVGGSLVSSLTLYLDKCVAKTVWETIEINYDLRVSEKPFVPSVCLYASVDSYNDTIFYGNSFTVHCVVFSLSNLDGETVKLLHISVDGTETHLPLNYSESEGHDVYNFHALVSNVSESNIGEYICMFTLDTTAYYLEENDSVTINIIARPVVSEATITEIPVQVHTTDHNITLKSSELSTSVYTATSESFTPQIEDKSYQDSLLIIYCISAVTIATVIISVIILAIILLFSLQKKDRKLKLTETAEMAEDNIYITIPEFKTETKIVT